MTVRSLSASPGVSTSDPRRSSWSPRLLGGEDGADRLLHEQRGGTARRRRPRRRAAPARPRAPGAPAGHAARLGEHVGGALEPARDDGRRIELGGGAREYRAQALLLLDLVEHERAVAHGRDLVDEGRGRVGSGPPGCSSGCSSSAAEPATSAGALVVRRGRSAGRTTARRERLGGTETSCGPQPEVVARAIRRAAALVRLDEQRVDDAPVGRRQPQPGLALQPVADAAQLLARSSPRCGRRAGRPARSPPRRASSVPPPLCGPQEPEQAVAAAVEGRDEALRARAPPAAGRCSARLDGCAAPATPRCASRKSARRSAFATVRSRATCGTLRQQRGGGVRRRPRRALRQRAAASAPSRSRSTVASSIDPASSAAASTPSRRRVASAPSRRAVTTSAPTVGGAGGARPRMVREAREDVVGDPVPVPPLGRIDVDAAAPWC